MNRAPVDVLVDLYQTLVERKSAAAGKSYVASLYARGTDVILKKLGEEAAETIIAAKNPDDAALVYELADLWFHSLVLMASRDIPVGAITTELARRMGTSGLEEKAGRMQQGGQHG
ncbi:MAG: phosphoribosyl-ATP diphosphatase [Stenotrophobium sp.]